MIDEYMDNNKDVISSNNIVHEMNGIVLCDTSDGLFDLSGVMIDDVTKYCKSHGYIIDKIIFLTSYDIEFSNNGRYVERLNNNTLRKIQKNTMKSNSKISIIEEDGKIIARVFMGSSISLDKAL